MRCVCDWVEVDSRTGNRECEVHGDLRQIYFSNVKPGMRIFIRERDSRSRALVEWVATDKVSTSSTAWENYDYDIRTFVNPLTGQTKDYDGLSPPEMFEQWR